MLIDVRLLPSQLSPFDLADRTVVIFDVLRATSSMIAALAAGVEKISVFPNVNAARAALRSGGDQMLLCGEERCIRPADFDLGNSPGAFIDTLHHGKTLLMATTNGTGAILAARGATRRLIGALINASAVARRVDAIGSDVTLLCAGTGGEVAAEDLIGAGAVIHALCRLNPHAALRSDRAWIAHKLFIAVQDDLPAALRSTTGGRNVLEAGLEPDVDFAARLDALDVVGEVVQSSEDAVPFVSRGASR